MTAVATPSSSRRAAVMFVWMLFWTALPVSATPITVTVGSTLANVGDMISVPIAIDGTVDLTSFQFDLTFDPTLLQAVAVTEGVDYANAAASSGGLTLFNPGVIDNTTGLISLVTDSMVGLFFGGGLAPGGVLATVDFLSVAAGVSPLTLSNVFLTESGQVLTAVNQEFSVESGQAIVATPEPATLTLIGSGVFALALRRRKLG